MSFPNGVPLRRLRNSSSELDSARVSSEAFVRREPFSAKDLAPVKVSKAEGLGASTTEESPHGQIDRLLLPLQGRRLQLIQRFFPLLRDLFRLSLGFLLRDPHPFVRLFLRLPEGIALRLLGLIRRRLHS